MNDDYPDEGEQPSEEWLAGYRQALRAGAGLDVELAEAEKRLHEGVTVYSIVRLHDDPAFNQMWPNLWRVEAGNGKDRLQDERASGRTITEALARLAAAHPQDPSEPETGEPR